MERRTQAAVFASKLKRHEPAGEISEATVAEPRGVTEATAGRRHASRARYVVAIAAARAAGRGPRRIAQIVEGRDRLDGLVEAMLVVTSGLELDATLRTIVAHRDTIWSTPVTGRSGCAGTATISWRSSTRESTTKAGARIGHLPEGRGVLGVLIDDPQADPVGRHPAAPGVGRISAEPPADAGVPGCAGADTRRGRSATSI